MYPLLASGTDTEYIIGQRADDYGLSAESAALQVKELQPNIVFLCSPNNPTGTGLGLDVVEAVYAAGEASQTIVIVDEAYHEFAHDGTPSALTLLPGPRAPHCVPHHEQGVRPGRRPARLHGRRP